MTQVNPTSVKLAGIRADLALQVLDQQEAIDLCLVAMVMADHVALVGPQGEGKTYLAERLSYYMPGSLYYHLLTRFTVPDEVLGHPSLMKLQQDVYERRTTGKAPEAELVVLDEVFKANSPMLNSLLGMMNERVVDGKRCKLRTLVGLSNEWPRAIDTLDRRGDDESLLPLWDRFVLRLEITQPQGDDVFRAIVRNHLPQPSVAPLTIADIKAIDIECAKFHANLPESIISSLLDIRAKLATKGISVSSRRWHKASKALAAYAIVCGDDAVKHKHLKVLRHVLWQTPSQRETIEDAVMQSGAPETAVALSMEAEAQSALKTFRGLPKSSTDRPIQLQDLIRELNVGVRSLAQLRIDPKTVDHAEIERVELVLSKMSKMLLAEMHEELSL